MRGDWYKALVARRAVRVVLWLVAAIVALPLVVAWAYTAYAIGSGNGLAAWWKVLWLALLVGPVLAASAYVLLRGHRRWHGTGALGRGEWAATGLAAAGALATLGVVGFTVAIDLRQPGAPPAFYDSPSPLPELPAGSLLRSEPLERAPPGVQAWRILYLSTRLDGTPSAVSATVAVPGGDPPEGGWPVVAWAHGTVGIARNCAPSLRANWPEHIDGLDLFLDAGYAVVSTDYEGMGGEGDHPYLVGSVAAMNVLDAVRAAGGLDGGGVGEQFVVWGASQGGHTALATGELAPGYAPALELAGVVAAAPPTDLALLFDANLGTTFGNVLAAMAFSSWSKVYEEAELGQVVGWLARPVVRNVASYCFLEEKESLAVLPGAALLGVTFLNNDPLETEPWATLLAGNSAGGAPIEAPLLVVQGETDPLVVPEVTEAYVNRLCDEGALVEYRTYPGVGHIPIGPEAAPDVAAWIAARFAGEAFAGSC